MKLNGDDSDILLSCNTVGRLKHHRLASTASTTPTVEEEDEEEEEDKGGDTERRSSTLPPPSRVPPPNYEPDTDSVTSSQTARVPDAGDVSAAYSEGVEGEGNSDTFYQRRLTRSEIVAEVMQGVGSRVSIHVVALRHAQPFSKDVVLHALQKLAASHPILWTTILSTESSAFTKTINKRFTEMPDSEKVVNLTYLQECPLSWLQVIEDQLMTNFNSSIGPMWRCVFLETKPETISKSLGKEMKHGICIFVIHDVIADSISILDLLMNQFPKYLSSPNLEHIIIPQAPPLDDIFPLCNKTNSLINSLRRSLRKGSSKKDKKKRPIKVICPLLHVGEDPMLTVASETRVILIDLEASTKQQFDHCCGERNILPEDALMVASAIALKIAVREQKKANPCMVFSQDVVLRIKCLRERSLRSYANIASKEGIPPLGLWSIFEQVNIDCLSLNQLNNKYPSSNAFWEDVILASTLRTEEPWCKLKDLSNTKVSSDYELMVDMCSRQKQVHIKFEYIKNSNEANTTCTTASYYYGHSLKDLDPSPLGVFCCDINPKKLSICITYNSRWLTREFTACYAQTLHTLLIQVSNPLKANMKKILKLPAFIRQQVLDKL